MRKITSIASTLKPTLADKARAFAENGKARETAKAAAQGSRVFFAPEGYRRLTINLPEDLHKKLKVRAAEQECTATEIIERLLKEELG